MTGDESEGLGYLLVFVQGLILGAGATVGFGETAGLLVLAVGGVLSCIGLVINLRDFNVT